VKNMSTVLITGGAGFIGSHTVELLLKENFYVIVLDNFRSSSKENLNSILQSSRVSIINGDIRDFSLLKSVMRDVDAVIHLAAIVSVDEANSFPDLAFQVNANGTLNVLEAMRYCDVERIVYASSAAVYGNPIYLPIDEKHPLFPLNPYGASKLAGEALVNAYQETYGLKSVVLRYFNVFGPRMKAGPYAGVVLKFITSALSNKPLIIYGDGKQVRDFIYVKDVAMANLIAVKGNVTGVFNIGTGKKTRIIDLARKIIDLTRSKSEIKFAPARPGDVRESVANIVKAEKELEWKPNFSLEQGLKNTIRFFSAMRT